jgi:hypothetical protein
MFWSPLPSSRSTVRIGDRTIGVEAGETQLQAAHGGYGIQTSLLSDNTSCGDTRLQFF